ncbi:DOMON domain-containing protein / dopamine beta-monooxygenase N-terminal domain-containing protein [Wolffia australiana]
MRGRAILPSLIVFFLLSLMRGGRSLEKACPERNSTFSGFESDLVMVQHQVRGIFRVEDACSFSVRKFDMLPGSGEVRWWGAAGEGFENMTQGFEISDLPLNRTYNNETIVVRLKNRTWDEIGVVSVWDASTSSDFGHVVLKPPAPSRTREPTMFDNCRALSPRYRLRWTLGNDSVDVGVESAVGSQYYMAFGWSDPGSASPAMIRSDIVVSGFTEEGNPFAEDYYISANSECLQDKDGKSQGVCPDRVYKEEEGGGSAMVNNTKLIYGHRKDGVSFIRFNRLLKTGDVKFDIVVNKSESMAVIWALGKLRPPDALHPLYLPQKHEAELNQSYGFLTLNLSQSVDDCAGPLDAEDKDDQDLIIADRKTPLVVTSGPPVRYPNPPSPSKVLYINKKEAPTLRVERGVPVKFSIQAGHDVALYVTSDPVGGNAASRNVSEVIYAGGAEAEGVPASPNELLWLPDRKTPDQVYYQSFFGKKMGWKIQVVDGGLSDMYNNSVLLDDQQVTLFWSLSEDSISLAARGEKKSGYLAIAFGAGMVNSFAYVGWVDEMGKAHVSSYWIDGRDASNLHPTSENLTDVSCKMENGIVTFEFTRLFSLSCTGRIECKNVIDPAAPLKVVWALGAQWSEGNLTERNMHSLTSFKPMRVMLMHGSAEADQDLRPVLAVHGFMMFVAWGILIPGGILSARYLKHVKGDGWFKIHVYLQYSGVAIMLLGLLFATAELGGFSMSSLHVKFGFTALVLACAQPVNACIRPKKPANGEVPSSKRILWEYSHVIIGRCAVGVGIASLITGMKHLGDRYGDENAQGLNWALVLWFLVGALVVVYLEYSERKRRMFNRNSSAGTWVLGNTDDDDSADLLHHRRIFSEEPDNQASSGMEIQLEPISR